ncbi:MAG: nitroreductase family deazaflavin-dependent oxidoreductase [Actinomycetia bacterium]|nr:nitroreductase family deazaflavin-dependent oxidoreductase [Actinomycetes bacterium]
MLYRDLMRYLGGKTWFQITAAKLAPIDAKILKRTKGRFGLMGNYGLPQCLVQTIGRKSGQPRTVTLLYGTRGDEILLVGSNFGQKHHPAWALNLEADPAAEITRGDETAPYLARMVTDSKEREEIWQIMYAIWPAYHAYRGKAGREIKMFSLTPA